MSHNAKSITIILILSMLFLFAVIGVLRPSVDINQESLFMRIEDDSPKAWPTATISPEDVLCGEKYCEGCTTVCRNGECMPSGMEPCDNDSDRCVFDQLECLCPPCETCNQICNPETGQCERATDRRLCDDGTCLNNQFTCPEDCPQTFDTCKFVCKGSDLEPTGRQRCPSTGACISSGIHCDDSCDPECFPCTQYCSLGSCVSVEPSPRFCDTGHCIGGASECPDAPDDPCNSTCDYCTQYCEDGACLDLLENGCGPTA